MLRYEDLKNISDGRLYELNDMVRADCADCEGCSKCCESDMGDSIQLDPLDVYRLMHGLGRSFDSLIHKELELSVVDGLILPHMRMSGRSEPMYKEGSDTPVIYDIGSGCMFLGNDGRCTIHDIRPGICRLFPLGRIYEKGGFKYILQVNECIRKNRSKVKVSRWIDTENLDEYEAFVRKWHNFKTYAAKRAAEADDDPEGRAKRVMIYILSGIYAEPYKADSEKDFYPEFDSRLKVVLKHLRELAR